MDDMAVMSAGFRLEERGSHDKLFHTKAVVRDRVCALTIDHWSSINVASIEMVEKLGLPRTPHPQPYYLHWGSDEFTITQQTKVQICMGKFSGEVCCNIIPVYMVSCHLLLGKPWYGEQGVVPYLDHINKYYKYVVTCGRVTYHLLSMDTALFKTWRDDRLQDKKNKEEAKKKEAEAASIFVVPAISADKEAQSVVISAADSAIVDIPVVNVQSIHEAIAMETGSKPRSVSPEDGGMMWHLMYLIRNITCTLRQFCSIQLYVFWMPHMFHVKEFRLATTSQRHGHQKMN
jgi:hypothetical protein